MSLDRIKKIKEDYNYADSSEILDIIRDLEDEAEELYYSMNDEDDAELLKVGLKKIIMRLKWFVDSGE